MIFFKNPQFVYPIYSTVYQNFDSKAGIFLPIPQNGVENQIIFGVTFFLNFKITPMQEKLPDEKPSLKKQNNKSQIQIGSFAEFTNNVQRHFLSDEWRTNEDIAHRAYPGTRAEFNAACVAFFKTQFTSRELTLEEIVKGDLVLSVYDFLNYLGIEKKAFRFQDGEEKEKSIAALRIGQ